MMTIKSNRQPELCEVKGCKSKSVVGLGPTWYCIRHFEAALKPIGRGIKRLAKELSGK